MNNQWSNVINSAVASLGMCVKVCQNTLPKQDAAELLEKFENIAKKYCILDNEHQATVEAIAKTQDYFSDKENDNKVVVKKIYDKYYKPSKANINKHDLLVKFQEEIKDVETQDEDEQNVRDGDIITSNSFVPPIDPISKTQIQHPVRNNECGHVYEKETICAMISQKNTRCPYIGCPAVHYIQKENLISDDELKRKIDNYRLRNM